MSRLMPSSYLFFFFLLLHITTSHTLPLSTKSRWIIDEKGQRVKLACVNWVSHLDVAVAEGLSKQPVDVISKKIRDMGFNCVRLTWPVYLATNDSLASLTVRQSFLNAGLSNDIPGLQTNNPSFVDLALIRVFQAVVASLTNNNVMVILDNHISKPGWCCNDLDGNGFFGDQYFDPELWINGLTKMASLFKNNSYVIAMGLRNELRGPKQNANDWFRYMQRGAEAVHEANPNMLVMLGGLSYSRDLSFLHNQSVSLSFTGKLVFEFHWYWWSDGPAWVDQNSNQFCGRVLNNNKEVCSFLLDQGYPVIVSEWGVDMSGTSANSNRYLNCLLSWIIELDLDWALWTVVGSYYSREGVIGYDETYGLLNPDWTQVRNTNFLQRISAIQSTLQGPGLSDRYKHKIIFHPNTGLCILRNPLKAMGVKLGNCADSNHWSYTAQNTLAILGSHQCLQAQGLDRLARLSLNCGRSGTRWTPISDSKMHLSTSLHYWWWDSSTVCLDVDSDNNIITTTCKCLSRDNKCDPQSQWFKIVDVAEAIGIGVQTQPQLL